MARLKVSMAAQKYGTQKALRFSWLSRSAIAVTCIGAANRNISNEVYKRLYHFINEKCGLADLREKRLKIGRIMELNDPFEFMGVDLADSSFRESMENTKKDLSEEFGILCFSESWNDPVQWAHYADGQKGLSLGFDIPDCLLAEVNYVFSLELRKRISNFYIIEK